jgi:serine/threonine protein kinase
MSNFFDKYEIVERIASGGMAEIYRAYLHGVEGFQKEVAIKMIRPQLLCEPEFVDMFISEATLAAKLNHPNIVRVNEFDQIKGTYYIVMEFIKGIDLRAAQKKQNGPWDPSLVFFIATKLLSALNHAHTLTDNYNQPLELIHRDVSPHNILLSINGEVKLVDFGIAKIRNAVSYTKSNMVRGKLHYLSPEQARGDEERKLDSRSDLFSLGLVLWALLTGQRRYIQNEKRDIFTEIMEGKFIPPSSINTNLDKRVDDLMYGLLAPLKTNRYPSAEDAIESIQSLYFADNSEIISKLVKKWIPNTSVPLHESISHDPTIKIQQTRSTELLKVADDWKTNTIAGTLYAGTNVITELHKEKIAAREGSEAYSGAFHATKTTKIETPKKKTRFNWSIIAIASLLLVLIMVVVGGFIFIKSSLNKNKVSSLKENNAVESNSNNKNKENQPIIRVIHSKSKSKNSAENNLTKKPIKLISPKVKNEKLYKGKVIILGKKRPVLKKSKKISTPKKPTTSDSGLKSIKDWD